MGFTNMAGAQIWRTTAMDILSVTTTSIGDEMVGGSYVTTLTANAGTAPLAWSITSGSLPDGESLSSTGIISGTPTKSGTYTFTVTVVDSGNPQQTASRELSIKVNDAPATLPETGADGYFNWAGSLL